MHRIFREASDKIDNIIHVDGEDYHHINNVLRLKLNDTVEVVIDKKIYICNISSIENKLLKLFILNELENLNLEKLNIHLYQGLTKGDKFDYIIQKSVELGVTTITPLITKRVIVKLKDKNLDTRIKRYNKISKQAASQSHRISIPKISLPVKINDLILEKDELGLVAYEDSDNRQLKEILKSNIYNNIKIVIGPEGGFEKEEILNLKDKGFNIISLGPRILRTETAPLNILSILQYEIGDF
ncbi:RsmE family RNA methyltransferase [Miniphocaeibacter massiliensis]|uniref:RsmE family RNA methyltransferase n=1 Tax=Miniphocaeibacter massiliensis TaxID=2041841 RepID=UPI000C087C50|nr:RsmE family RNA methyltransferase [Miniphocaeibacter massiliensis]